MKRDMKMDKWYLTLIAGIVISVGIARGQPSEPQPASPEQLTAVETNPGAPADPRAAVGTAFTYQGELRDNNVVVSGTYDMQFRLYDDASAVVAGPICLDGVQVTDGLFTVELDFGAVFTGDNRHLEIGVRADATPANCGGGVYTTLAPRQKLTLAPYSGRSLAPWVTSGTNLYYSAGNVSVGTSSSANKLDVEGGAAIGATYSGTSVAPTNGLIVQGNVGLGTTTVANKLDVEGGAAIGATYSGTSAAPTNGLIVQGNVGIGTPTATDGKLVVNSGTGPGIKIDSNGSALSNASLHIANTNPAGIGAWIDGTSTDAVMVLGNDGAGSIIRAFGNHDPCCPVFRVEANGWVGINSTVVPSAPLDVAGNVNVTGGITHADPINFVGDAVEQILQINGVELIGRHTANGAVTIGADDSLVIGDGESPGTVAANVSMTAENTYVSSDNSVFFYTNLQAGWASRNVVLFRDDGNVGIATTSPGSRLDVRATGARNAVAGYADTSNYSAVYGETSVVPLCNEETAAVRGRNPTENVTGALARGSLSGTCEFPVYYAVYGSATGGDYAGYFSGKVRVNGNLGIGREPLANDLEVEGTASKTASGSWLANSDCRIKTDIRTINNALDSLNKVRLVDFRYSDEYRAKHPTVEDRRYANVVAQEFADVFPDYVKSSGEKLASGDEILQVDTYPLTIYSAAAVQELGARLREKDKQIADLTARLDRLERSLDATPSQKGGVR